MTSRPTGKVGTAVLATAILLSSRLPAQERPPLAARSTAYSEARETVLQGTVLNYVENSAVAPIGAHVTVQTASGTADVHLGPASFLQANHFSLSAGDSVKFVGMSITTDKGAVFLARIAQKGDQSITIRSPRGFLLAPAAARTVPQPQGSQATQGVAR
jgi:hypothetical protein